MKKLMPAILYLGIDFIKKSNISSYPNCPSHQDDYLHVALYQPNYVQSFRLSLGKKTPIDYQQAEAKLLLTKF